MDTASDGAAEVRLPTVPVRLLAPLSTARVTSRRPTLRWELGLGADGAHVQICRDRVCAVTVAEFDVLGTSAAPPATLPSGVLFWRAYARTGTVSEVASTATWQFTVGVRSAAVDTAWGTSLDVNGDGFADVAVGAPGVGNGAGRAYVYLGSPAGLSTTPATAVTVPEWAGVFGAIVKSAGDVDGDGFGDLLVATGAPARRGYIYRGSATGISSTVAATIDPRDMIDSGHDPFISTELASAGDLNGDGYADVMSGVSGGDGVNSVDGTLGVFFGTAKGVSRYAIATAYPESRVRFALALTGLGDVNADGFSDVLVTVADVIGLSLTPSSVSRLYLYPGSAMATVQIPTNPFAVSETLDSAAPAGDLNGDGYGDIIVGSVMANGNRIRGDYPGGAFVYLGSAAGLPAVADAAAVGLVVTGSSFGHSVAGIGDVNGDGYADVAVGAPGTAAGAGSVHIFQGAATGFSLNVAATNLNGPAGAAAGFGFSVAGAGDVNGDGFSDVIVGAPGTELDAGRAYLYLGSATGLSTTPSVTLTGPDGPGGRFGAAVAGAE